MSITINSKLFEILRYPSPSSVLLRTLSRGVTLPDTFLVSTREQKSAINPADTVRFIATSLQWAFIDAVTGARDYNQLTVTLRTPSNSPSTDVDGVFADYFGAGGYLASAITPVAANVARMKSGSIGF